MDYLSVAEVAKRWKVRGQFVYGQIAQGKLQALKMGSPKRPVVRVPRDSLEQYEAAQMGGAK